MFGKVFLPHCYDSCEGRRMDVLGDMALPLTKQVTYMECAEPRVGDDVPPYLNVGAPELCSPSLQGKA